jgi:nicotinate phosphoribosyltransferase
MAFPSEEEAFQAYADIYPEYPVFLIDTYDTLKSGVLNAIKVGKRVEARGKNFGVRLDSGDIHYLSVQVRRMLDAAGLTNATIAVSNDLDESIIQTLTDAGSPINTWGVGTRMVTGGNDAAFTGVYKLSARAGPSGGGSPMIPVMKFSDNPEKTTNPGIKQVWRIRDGQGMAVSDVLGLDDGPWGKDSFVSGNSYTFWHPAADYRHFYHTLDGSAEPLLKPHLEDGKPVGTPPSLEEIRKHVKADLENFDDSYKRLLNPHVYKVSISQSLRSVKLELIKNYLGDL